MILPEAVIGTRVDELDGAGNLVGGEMLAAVGQQTG